MKSKIFYWRKDHCFVFHLPWKNSILYRVTEVLRKMRNVKNWEKITWANLFISFAIEWSHVKWSCNVCVQTELLNMCLKQVFWICIKSIETSGEFCLRHFNCHHCQLWLCLHGEAGFRDTTVYLAYHCRQDCTLLGIVGQSNIPCICYHRNLASKCPHTFFFFFITA